MNKSDLTEILAERADVPKVRAGAYIDIVVDAIRDALIDGEKVIISDFGTFNVSNRREFAGRNPQSGTTMTVPSRRIPVFRAGKRLKKMLNDHEVDI